MAETLVGTAKRWPLNRGLIAQSFLQPETLITGCLIKAGWLLQRRRLIGGSTVLLQVTRGACNPNYACIACMHVCSQQSFGY